ncbi:hypothetical protein [Streptomyces sp. NPDC058157]|uniref:hypothetical protein n=1 Tax=Streptomyces sp. NPDC058157 TaxID=3346360 RepID=UPI0036E11AF2
MRRRRFLLLAATAATAAGTSGCDSGSGSAETPSATRHRADSAGFANPLRIPPLLEPTLDAAGVKTFTLTAQRGRTEFLPGKPAPTWGFNGSYLGPTLRARAATEYGSTSSTRSAIRPPSTGTA